MSRITMVLKTAMAAGIIATSVSSHAANLGVFTHSSAVAVHPPQYVQGLTFKGVAPPSDLYCRREPLEVGSVSPFLCR